MREYTEINLERRKKNKLKDKNKLNKRFNIIILISLIFLMILFIQFIFQRKKIHDLNQRSNILISDANNLKLEIQRLQQELDKVNNLEYIEKFAREKLGMIKKEEKIYLPNENSNNTEKEADNEENNGSSESSQSEGNDAR